MIELRWIQDAGEWRLEYRLATTATQPPNPPFSPPVSTKVWGEWIRVPYVAQSTYELSND